MIDAHAHVWDLATTPQPWIPAQAAPTLERDFTLAELCAAALGAGVDQAILVQSVNSVRETTGLVRQGEAEPFVAGVVGWADLADRGARAAIEKCLDDPGGHLLCGYRHVFAPGEAASWFGDRRVQSALDLFGRLGLAFDLLLRAPELPLAAEIARRHPGTVFVLDHLAKPDVRLGEMEPWRRDILNLGRQPNVYAKFSGLPAEADWSAWSASDLRPYFDTALEAFGPERLIFATDWPVCTVAGPYRAVAAAQLQLCAALTPGERHRLLGGNAAAAYGRIILRLSSGLSGGCDVPAEPKAFFEWRVRRAASGSRSLRTAGAWCRRPEQFCCGRRCG
jgi:L-fuconolactonase